MRRRRWRWRRRRRQRRRRFALTRVRNRPKGQLRAELNRRKVESGVIRTDAVIRTVRANTRLPPPVVGFCPANVRGTIKECAHARTHTRHDRKRRKHGRSRTRTLLNKDADTPQRRLRTVVPAAAAVPRWCLW